MAAATVAIALGAGGPVAVSAATLPLPIPSPSLPSVLPSSTPSVVPSATPLPLASLSPAPLPTLPAGTTASPSPGGGGAGASGGSGAGGGAGSAQGSGGGGGQPGSGGGGGAGQPGGSGPVASIQHSGGPAGIGPLPAFPGLPNGAAQQLAWALVFLVPLMLLVWVVVLIRAVGRLRRLRGSAELIAAASELGLSPREIAGLSPLALEKLRDQLALDELTGCMRRVSGIAALERELARARRERGPLALGFVDADGLKHANDTLGHAAGDQLLKDVAAGLRSRLRGSDFVFRYGGDEFVCVLPSATAESAAEVLSDVQAQLRLRGRSFSYGIAELAPADTIVTILGRADEALYAAKRALANAEKQPGEARTPRRLPWSVAPAE